LIRQGWKVHVVDFEQKPVIGSLLEAAAESEMRAAVKSYTITPGAA
jgi:hypothetical protein